MSSNSPPPQGGGLRPLSAADSATTSSPFRSLLSSPMLSRQRANLAARTSSTSSVSSPASPQPPPPRPASVLPSFLGSPLTPPPPPAPSHSATGVEQGDDSLATREHESKANRCTPLLREESPIPPACSTTAHTPTPGGENIGARVISPSGTSAVGAAQAISPHSSTGSTATVPQQFCLRWNNYQSNLTSVFDQLLQSESFVDVTLACDGRSIKAHKMILSACSPYFQMLFSDTPCQHPIVIMRDVNWSDLKAIVEFMYRGEINVSQDQIGPLLRIAEMLKVRGLADVSAGSVSAEEAAAERLLKELHSPSKSCSPKRGGDGESPASKRERKDYPDPLAESEEPLSFLDAEKKLRLGRTDWDFSTATSGSNTSGDILGANSNLELRLSPLLLPQQQQQQASQQQLQQQQSRHVRKRRWPSADMIFNPPPSPLSGLIAAERAERERERERDRDCTIITPPQTTSAAGTVPSSTTQSSVRSTSRLTPSLLETATHLDLPSPSTTPAPSLLRPMRTPPGVATHLSHQQSQQQAHHQQQQQQQQQSHLPGQAQSQQSHLLHSHRASPASSAVTPTHPSSLISGQLTATTVGSSGVSGRSEQGGGSSDSRFALGSQAAAMAAAVAAQMDLGAMGMPHGSAPPPTHAPHHHTSSLADDLEIKPGIAEMIREEERAKMLENSHTWMGASSSSTIAADSYQYQLQSMWQKCWNTNQSLMHHLRFRERGPLKSWRPETMAEAIFSVLKEGLSLSQAARKYDIPYPTFVLYANRVHNMLGPSIDGGPDLRPKGRGRPQRILLGIWPDEHIKGVIKTVVFRDAKDLKDDSIVPHLPYGRHSPMFPFQDGPLNYPGMSGPCPNGVPTPTGDQMSQEATAAAVAAVAHNIRQQMQLAAAVQHQHPSEGPTGPGLFNIPPHLQPHLAAAASAGTGGAAPGVHGSVPLPKTSISPALSTTSNPSAGTMLGPRHAPSPCGPGLSGLPPNIPPSMAMALHMGRCDPTGVLSQQQQHQLQHLHMQQQQALQQQQQQHHQQQHQQQQHGFGYGVSSMPHHGAASASATATSSSSQHYQQHQLQHQQPQAQQQQLHQHQQHHQSASVGATATKAKCPSPSSLLEHRRSSPSGNSHLHSTLTELGLDMGYKTTRSSAYSPTRLFSEDLAALVGASEDSPPGTTASSTNVSSTSTVTTPAMSGSHADVSITSSATSGNISSSNIKIEPITTSSE